ncbi:hypothetical protein BJF79_32570 [Actinomadura sp. CNU-125]|uniref:LamG-like jellyroll fold domain-containing protein n=1 Tax=Actinomadura sp. CNU-125 TaxID=1904961 RepID=UPI000960C051|nr:LamG-like jellyroll fold domain-containing protein [Actinomadura sp. CNU-125]OLT35057.1 hypothetical protein BJF79_32570 [Actinomadura sp. CNU-125]
MRIRRSPALFTTALFTTVLLGATLAVAPGAAAPAQASPLHLRRDLVAHYDFDHPVHGDPARERDLGRSGTPIDLVNGGAAMRVRDGARRNVLQVRQVGGAANDDWKAGVYSETGVRSLRAFGAAGGATLTGWFKMTGVNPAPDTNTADPDDTYNAIGLSGVLTGDSDGHAVRALLEIIEVDGELRVVALGRRVDGGTSQTFAADRDWRAILPRNTWVHLIATFDYDTGAMKLYRDGEPLPGFYTRSGDPWQVEGPPEPDVTSATDPRGIKIGGSFPQDDAEANPCDCRMDDLMFLDRPITDREARRVYRITKR